MDSAALTFIGGGILAVMVIRELMPLLRRATNNGPEPHKIAQPFWLELMRDLRDGQKQELEILGRIERAILRLQGGGSSLED